MAAKKPTKKAVAAALKALDQPKKPFDPKTMLYGEQLQAHNDPTPDRCITGTRQWGKTRFSAVESIHTCLTKPGTVTVYCDMSKEHGEKVLFEDYAKLLDQYQIPAKLLSKTLEFYNDSIVYLFSGQPSELEMLQGLKTALVIIDEAQEVGAIQDLLTMVRPGQVLHSGRILVMGIPGRIRFGKYWDIAEGVDSKFWGQHRGDIRRNPFLPEESRNQIIETAKRELGENSPDFQRHWKGLWPTGDDVLKCFKYDPNVNGYDGEPPPCKYFGLGLDPGGVLDAEACVVVGSGTPDGAVYVVDEDVSEKKEGGDWDITGERVGRLQNKWNCDKRFLDYGSTKKSGHIVRYQRDQLILLDAVPDKDPEAEFAFINKLLKTKKLFIRRGSQVEKDLMYTVWDAESLAAGKPKQAKSIHKQNSIDALRAALWSVDMYMKPEVQHLKLSEADQEALKLQKILSSTPKPPTIETAADRLLGTGKQLQDIFGPPQSRKPPKPWSPF